MEHLERLSKVVRYAGLNLTPQILSVLLDENVRNLVDKLDASLKANPNTDLDTVDAIINEIQEAAVKQQEAEAKKAKTKAKKASEKKPTLEKA
jgi:hypothetical protein